MLRPLRDGARRKSHRQNADLTTQLGSLRGENSDLWQREGQCEIGSNRDTFSTPGRGVESGRNIHRNDGTTALIDAFDDGNDRLAAQSTIEADAKQRIDNQ